MTRAFRQTDLTRAIKAAQAAGLTVTRAKVAADGEVELEFATGQPAPPQDPFDFVDMRR